MSLFGKKRTVAQGSGRFTHDGYDRENQTPAIRRSICTGEKVAGFLDNHSGRFTEVMLIRRPADEEEFKRTYGVDSLKEIY